MKKQTFITNSKESTSLKKRLYQLIEHSKELKFLVGFFYFSGWQQLYEALRERDDLVIKILVGLQVDSMLGQMVEVAGVENNLSVEEKLEQFFTSLTRALNTEEMDIKDFYEQVDFFIGLIESDRLHIRKTSDPNHAKLYLFKIKDTLQGLAEARFITGSSNLTKAGMLEQNEFNVEIGDYGTEEAEVYFDWLWNTAIPITEVKQRKSQLINAIYRKTQAATVTPFEAYTLVLKNYIELHEQKKVKPQVIKLLEERGYDRYAYQMDAVNQALSILESYNGVIIADVVGLGKSIIASMIAKHTGKRGMIICPPGLMGDPNANSGWRKYMHDFRLYDWEIRSSGDLEKALDYVNEHGDDLEIIIIDEAHRFRNQDTLAYEQLSAICRNRQVIMLTATPFNNSPADIFALLKLFIIPGKSKITLDDNLEARFSNYNYLFKRLSFIARYHNSNDGDKIKRVERYYQDIFGELPVDMAKVNRRARYLAGQIRSVIEPVVIRRNRLDLKNDPIYQNEVTGLPEVENPVEMFFALDSMQSAFYDSVINAYFGEKGRFSGAIYRPFIYEKATNIDQLDEEGNREFQQQQNLYDFMRRLLVKRFESSFGAFTRSIENFIAIHQLVLQFIKNSGGKYILDRKLMERIYEEDQEDIQKSLDDFARQLENKKVPKNYRVYDVNKFQMKDDFLSAIQSDLQLLQDIRQEIDKLYLVENDPKAECLVQLVKNILSEKPRVGEPQRKVIIFTEFIDTVHHLQQWLEIAFPNKVLYVDGVLNTQKTKQLLVNFDASVKKIEQQNQFEILLTTDRLSEGVNLNRAGAVINYDIPWNPTRVIQRIGRINRIGQIIFQKLRIYNFFPSEQGADIVKSRQIAGQKMFVIHNTLGEDARIFEIDETPTASDLYTRINTNPDDYEDESLLTRIRKIYYDIADQYPTTIERISSLPPRVKTSKSFTANQLTVVRRKGLGLYIQHIKDTNQEKMIIGNLLFEDTLPLIKCEYDEERVSPSSRFWPAYELIKGYTEVYKLNRSDASLETKALNNLQSALRYYGEELEAYRTFIQTLIKDLRSFRTLSKYSLRRLAAVDLKPGNKKDIKQFNQDLGYLYSYLGEDYLVEVEQRTQSIQSEILIAIENVKNANG